MKKAFKRWWNRNRNVTTITFKLDKMLNQLDEHQTALAEAQQADDNLAEALAIRKNVRKTEMERAARVHSRVRAILD